jgi:hypothetical protein
MATEYLNQTGEEAHRAFKNGLCVVCSSMQIGYACRCRWCPQCKRNWLADTYAGTGPMPYVEKCEDCHAQDRVTHPRLSHACQFTNCNHCDGRGDCPCDCHKRVPVHLDNPAYSAPAVTA